MKALILAAGLGSRLQHKTQNIPKAMVSISGLPIISHQINALEENKIFEVGIVIGYKANILKEYLLKNHPNTRFTFFINDFFKDSNSAYSFYLASSFIKNDSYIHLNCDILFSNMLLHKIIKNCKKNVIAVNFKEELDNNMELVKINESKQITYMDNIFFEEAMGKAFGLAKFSSESSNSILNKIKMYHHKGEFNMNYYGIIRESLADVEYYCEDSNGFLLKEINTLDDYAAIDLSNKNND